MKVLLTILLAATLALGIATGASARTCRADGHEAAPHHTSACHHHQRHDGQGHHHHDARA